jgi:murein L,D-transpeptidase YafK
LNRPFVRALLVSAAAAAALALAGCDPQDVTPTGRSLAPLSEKMQADLAAKHMDKGSPILARLFKEESELEVWKQTEDGQYALLKTYPICRWSGDLGPKIKEGDRQAPEGFYTITPGQMNPRSNYYLAFNTGYPNAFDRAWGRTGSELMVHGDCSSRGCYAMTDEQIQEIYALARESFFGGQKDFQFEAFPFHMTAMNMARHRNNPNFAFWKELNEGYDNFEATHQEPKVAVCEKRYVFDAAPPENSTKPLRFDPRGKCPAYRLDPTVADAVLDHRRQEQYQMAKYIADGVTLAPQHVGDGGMNPVFASQLGAQEAYDDKGRLIRVATAPGALPRTPYQSAPANQVVMPASAEPAPQPNAAQPKAAQPVMVASVPMPKAAPQPKEGEAPEQPKSIAGLLSNLFGGSQAQAAQPAPPVPTQTAALRGSNTRQAAKPKHTPAMYTASMPAAAVPAKPRDAAPAKPKEVAKSAPAPQTPAPEMRTAFSAPQSGDGVLLRGAQPVVPAGSFESRWTALR